MIMDMAMAAAEVAATPPPQWLRCSPLGHGTTATVSLSLNLRSFSFFAAKSTALSSPHLPSLLHELHILQSISSPYIVSFLGFDASLYSSLTLFLEFMDSGSIADLLRRSATGRFPESDVRSISRSVLRGLDYLHSDAGVVHGDIKGSNILLNSSGEAKIADFGCSRRIGSGGGCGGTPLWMAPEVVQGLDQGPASDIWSFGCTVVEMLQGKAPFAHITDVAALLFQLAFCKESPPLPDCISADATDFLLRCLNPDPNLRWTASQLLLHPFLAADSASPALLINSSLLCAGDRISPRSTLSFAYSVDSEEDDGDVATTSAAAVAQVPVDVSVCNAPISDACDWITVKSSENSSRKGLQKPFMGGDGSRDGLIRIRGCDVDLGAAAFLKERRKVVG